MDLQSAEWDYHFQTKTGIRVRGIANASAVGDATRHAVLSFYNGVAGEIWIMPPDWFHEIGAGLFPPDASIFLATDGDTPVGFNIVKRFPIRNRQIVFSWFANVRPHYQRLGTLDAITTFLLNRYLIETGSFPIYSFRTRNPVRWRAAARLMSRVALDFYRGTRDLELYGLAGDIAAHVYPDSTFDPETLAMPDAYPAGSGYQEPYHVADETLDRAFYAHPAVSSPTGALLGIGEPNSDVVAERIKEAGF